jgi:hypothetical protein
MAQHATTLRLPQQLVARLKFQAQMEGRSMTSLISELCDLGLRARGSENEDRLEEFRRLVRAAGSSP